jgi:hypothetical protein
VDHIGDHWLDFWKTAHCTARVPNPDIRSAGKQEFKCFDVRFEPSRIYKMAGAANIRFPAPTPTTPATPATAAPTAPNRNMAERRDHRPKIDKKTLLSWTAEYGRRNPQTSFGVFLRNARSAFPQFRVGERPMKAAIAELGLKLSVGNPTILRK